MVTICYRCKHCSKENHWSVCYAFKRKPSKRPDYVTGRKLYIQINPETGDEIGLVNDPFPYCKDFNKGDCPKFERSGAPSAQFNVCCSTSICDCEGSDIGANDNVE